MHTRSILVPATAFYRKKFWLYLPWAGTYIEVGKKNKVLKVTFDKTFKNVFIYFFFFFDTLSFVNIDKLTL